MKFSELLNRIKKMLTTGHHGKSYNGKIQILLTYNLRSGFIVSQQCEVILDNYRYCFDMDVFIVNPPIPSNTNNHFGYRIRTNHQLMHNGLEVEIITDAETLQPEINSIEPLGGFIRCDQLSALLGRDSDEFIVEDLNNLEIDSAELIRKLFTLTNSLKID